MDFQRNKNYLGSMLDDNSIIAIEKNTGEAF